MRLAIITARGGSKRIPRKNIRQFCGEPIISYSIRAALDAKCFDEVMVSTDDVEIAESAKKYGATVPFMRSAQTSSDYATTAEVLLEVIQTYHLRGVQPKLACCIYPTAPFVTSSSLKEGFNLLSRKDEVETVMPVTRFSFPIQRALKLKEGMLSMFQPEHLSTRSQDLEPAYHDAGQFYWFRVQPFMKTQKLIGAQTAGIVLPEWQVQDIDNEDDWLLAEMKYRFIEERQLVTKEEVA